jgi:hypothetical protein
MLSRLLPKPAKGVAMSKDVSRWVCLLGLFAMMAAVGGLVLLAATHDQPGVTLANYEKIQVGMTEEEVDSILGNEGGIPYGCSNGGYGDVYYCWEFGPCISVDYIAGKVSHKDWRPPPAFLQRLHYMLGL